MMTQAPSNPGDSTDPDGGTGQVAAHISKAADGDGYSHQTAQQIPQNRTVFKIFHQVFSHTLHHDYCNYRKDDAPEQLKAIISTSLGGTGDRPRSTLPQCKQLPALILYFLSFLPFFSPPFREVKSYAALPYHFAII